MVEIGPRGVLFIPYDEASYSYYVDREDMGRQPPQYAAEDCKPSAFGLCQLEEGLVLPSFKERNLNTLFPVVSDPSLLQNGALKLFAEADACGLEHRGSGRVYFPGREYTVSACDVIQGTHILVYRQGHNNNNNEVLVVEQTFGPIAYLIVLVSATLHICAVGCHSDNTDWIFKCNGILSVLACIILYFRGVLIFHLIEDEVFFGITALCALGYLVVTNTTMPEGYIFALCTLATALYRSHETPYAPIIAYIGAYRSIEKLVKSCHGAKKQNRMALFEYVDLFISLLHTSLFCEIAVKPQCLYQEVWPIYYMFHMFLCYHLVKYQELSHQSKL